MENADLTINYLVVRINGQAIKAEAYGYAGDEICLEFSLNKEQTNLLNKELKEKLEIDFFINENEDGSSLFERVKERIQNIPYDYGIIKIDIEQMEIK